MGFCAYYTSIMMDECSDLDTLLAINSHMKAQTCRSRWIQLSRRSGERRVVGKSKAGNLGISSATTPYFLPIYAIYERRPMCSPFQCHVMSWRSRSLFHKSSCGSNLRVLLEHKWEKVHYSNLSYDNVENPNKWQIFPCTRDLISDSMLSGDKMDRLQV